MVAGSPMINSNSGITGGIILLIVHGCKILSLKVIDAGVTVASG